MFITTVLHLAVEFCKNTIVLHLTEPKIQFMGDQLPTKAFESPLMQVVKEMHILITSLGHGYSSLF